LAVGGWRLAVGGWRLAVGGWRLAEPEVRWVVLDLAQAEHKGACSLA